MRTSPKGRLEKLEKVSASKGLPWRSYHRCLQPEEPLPDLDLAFNWIVRRIVAGRPHLTPSCDVIKGTPDA